MWIIFAIRAAVLSSVIGRYMKFTPMQIWTVLKQLTLSRAHYVGPIAQSLNFVWMQIHEREDEIYYDLSQEMPFIQNKTLVDIPGSFTIESKNINQLLQQQTRSHGYSFHAVQEHIFLWQLASWKAALWKLSSQHAWINKCIAWIDCCFNLVKNIHDIATTYWATITTHTKRSLKKVKGSKKKKKNEWVSWIFRVYYLLEFSSRLKWN